MSEDKRLLRDTEEDSPFIRRQGQRTALSSDMDAIADDIEGG